MGTARLSIALMAQKRVCDKRAASTANGWIHITPRFGTARFTEAEYSRNTPLADGGLGCDLEAFMSWCCLCMSEATSMAVQPHRAASRTVSASGLCLADRRLGIP